MFFGENVAGLRPATFSPKKHGLHCLSPSVFLCCFFLFILVFFCVLFSLFSWLFCVESFVQSQRIQWPMAEAAMPNRAQRAANKVLRETKNAAKAQESRGRNTQETMDTACGDEAGPKIWKNSRTSLRGRPKNGQNFGWGKNSRLWASPSAKKVLLTAEKVGIGPKLAKISGGVKPGHLEEGRGPKNGQNSIWGKTGHL